MTAEEEAIKARRRTALFDGQRYGDDGDSSVYAIERATTVTPEEFDRAYLVLISELGQGSDWRALRAAFAAAGFEAEP